MDKKEYFLYVKGKAVKVSEEVYKAYWRITEHEKYLQRKDWKYNVLPFSVFDYDGHFIDNIVDESIDIEKIVEVKMQIEELNKALNSLTEEERDIITAIFFREESLRSIGERKNRKIIAFNLEFRKLKEELSKLTSWIGSLIGSLQVKYDEYKQEKKEEYENKAELFNLYEYISIYYDLQGEKARKLNPYASNKKIGADLRRFSKARIYLKDNNLKTIADLQEKISTLQSKNKKISQDIKAKTTRIESLNKCFDYADIIKDNKQVFEEWNSKSLFKDSFYNSHKDEIDKYKRARAILEKITGSSAIYF